MGRRAWLKQTGAMVGTLLLNGCSADQSGAANATSTVAATASPLRSEVPGGNTLTLHVDAQASGRPVNRQLLGQNIQWVDLGDDMFDSAGAPKPAMVTLAQSLGTSALRYPGGLQSDTYHWERGMGLLTARGLNEHANARRMQPTIVGTQEFMELCETLNATPVITVNLASGTTAEAAAWVRQVNIERLTSSRTGKKLPKVTLWELGNEPYLKPDEQPSLWLTPTEFSQRARAFAAAMTAVDSSIQLSIPLTSDKRNGNWATPNQGFTRAVMATPIPGVTHVSLHNAYVPYGMDKPYTADQLYWGAMGGGRSVAQDLQAMRTLLAELQPGFAPRYAITEHNAMFTLGRQFDHLTKSPAGALCVADVLRQLAQEPDVDAAHFWSLSANDFFGAIHGQAYLRPTGHALTLFNSLLQGQIVPASLEAPTVSTIGVGAVEAQASLPVAEVLCTRNGHTLRCLLIHKDPVNAGHLSLLVQQGKVVSGEVLTLSCRDVLDTSDTANVMTRQTRTWDGQDALSVPAHSLTLLTLQLSA